MILNVGVFGLAPFVYRVEGVLDGVDLEIVNIMSEKLGFGFDLVPQRSWEVSCNLIQHDNINSDIFQAKILWIDQC